MKLTTLTALCAALPLIVATSISFLVPEEWKDTAIVKGKNSSDGGIETMTRATSDPSSAGVCAALGSNVWLDTDIVCKTKFMYNGVTWITFAEPTKDPRPINVTLGTDLYECNMTVGESGSTAWFVGWGLDAAIDGTKIVCKKGPVPE